MKRKTKASVVKGVGSIGLVSLLAGCADYVLQEQIDRAAQKCQPNGGVKEYWVTDQRYGGISLVVCENGAQFPYPAKQVMANAVMSRPAKDE